MSNQTNRSNQEEQSKFTRLVAEDLSDVTPIELTNEEYFEYSREFSGHHALFYTMWEMGKPFFCNHIPTAGVALDRTGQQVQFLFNSNFWNKLTRYERLFIIGHECLHVILNHGFRALNTEDHEIANKALDVVVNHMLVNRFGFIRKDISFADDLCWVDTLWEENIPPDDMNYEFYFNLLKEEGDSGKGELVDDHSGLGINADEWQEVVDMVGGAMNNSAKESIARIMEKHFQDFEISDDPNNNRGTVGGKWWEFANVGKIVVKKKWETVIRQWSKKFDNCNIHDVEQWARTNRRFVGLDAALFLPTEMEIEHEIEGKIQVWFFQDTSGSCAHFKDRFFQVALSLSKKRFDVKMHCFDTQVFETTLESRKLYGFGGTSFSALENYIQAYITKHKVEYPKAVFVITDGFGDYVNPQIPKNWYWFLNPFHTRCIPNACSKFNLKDFE
jgi:hypothetical protein